MSRKIPNEDVNEYHIAVLSNEKKIINRLSSVFEKVKYTFILYNDPLKMFKDIGTKKFDAAIINYIFPEFLLKELLNKMKVIDPTIFTILIAEHEKSESALKIVKNCDIQGFYDTSKNFTELILLTETCLNAVYEFYRVNLQLDIYSKQFKTAYLNTIQAIRNITEYKDTYTIGHSFRVSKYSVLIGKYLNLSRKELNTLKIGSLFHDIGKISTPNKILTKHSRLTDNEYYMLKTHPLIGAHFLSQYKNYIKILPIVKFHHERYDGGGYPVGLKGDDIPFLTRIVTIADTFDAMTSKRTYRDALPLDVVINEFKKCRGTQFDPALDDVFVDILKNHYDKILKIMKIYK